MDLCPAERRFRCDTVKEAKLFGGQMMSEIRCLRLKYAGQPENTLCSSLVILQILSKIPPAEGLEGGSGVGDHVAGPEGFLGGIAG